jgi:hypothetical protein
MILSMYTIYMIPRQILPPPTRRTFTMTGLSTSTPLCFQKLLHFLLDSFTHLLCPNFATQIATP